MKLPRVDWRRFRAWTGLAAVLAVWVFFGVIEQGARLLFGVPPWVWPVALFVLSAEAIAFYHGRRMAAIRGLELEAEGWQRIRPHHNVNWWVCPNCRNPVPDLPGAVEEHIDPQYSACGAFTERREDDERRERMNGSAAPMKAQFVGVRGSPGAGAVDSMNEESE
jgi:hypothetical protein